MLPPPELLYRPRAVGILLDLPQHTGLAADKNKVVRSKCQGTMAFPQVEFDCRVT